LSKSLPPLLAAALLGATFAMASVDGAAAAPFGRSHLAAPADVVPVSHRHGHYRWHRRGRHVHVAPPYTRVDRHRGHVVVDAPFAHVDRDSRGVRVRAPFVDIWVPRW
jgi:hypothetical protein